jgi:hypothetical protein
MEPDQPLPFVGEDFGEFISVMGWANVKGQPINVLPMQCPDVVQLDGNTAEEGSCGNTTPRPSKQARKRCVQKKNSNFCLNEDKLLVMSYLEVSNDLVVNTYQKLERLWCIIVKLYNQKRGSYPERTMWPAQSHWDVIKLQVGKFCGYYAEVTRGNHSGMTDADKVTI